MKIKKGDKVVVLAGKDRGKTGKVLKVLLEKQRVTVEGVNIHHKNTRPRRQNEKGQKVEFPASVHVSNVALLDGGKATRIGYRMEGTKKVRIAKKSKQVI